MSIFDKIGKFFGGHEDEDFQQWKQEVMQQIEDLDGAILDDGEGGAFEVEVLPPMNYADFIALCESLREERNGK